MNPSQDWLADKWLETIELLARSSYFRPHVSPSISRPKRPTAAMRCKRVKQERDRKRKKYAERLQRSRKRKDVGKSVKNQSMVPGTKMNRTLRAAATKIPTKATAVARLFKSFRT